MLPALQAVQHELNTVLAGRKITEIDSLIRCARFRTQ